jgi:RnfABCDGE-type electron transport complex B subunit
MELYMNNILHAVLVLGGLGIFFGLVLAVASKVFYVKVDERQEAVAACLSGANCGACGYAGCSAYASAIINNGAPINLCLPGGSETAEKISAVMGVAPAKVEKVVAFVRCSGGEKAHVKYEYEGIASCAKAASSISGGQRACTYGCLGFGDCVHACPFGAIDIVKGVALVDRDKCRSCKKCVAVCPKKLITMIPYSATSTIACNNIDKGGITRNLCESGCIGCKLCEKNCPHNAVHVENNVATKDFSKCTNCGICAEKCPRKLIAATAKHPESA